jgi:hypothetical protein
MSENCNFIKVHGCTHEIESYFHIAFHALPKNMILVLHSISVTDQRAPCSEHWDRCYVEIILTHWGDDHS